MTHLVLNFWHKNKTKYLLSTQIFIHRECIYFSFRQFNSISCCEGSGFCRRF